MSKKAKEMILDYLTINDEEMLAEVPNPSVEDLADILIERSNSLQVEVVVMEHAYEVGIPYAKYEPFFEEMMQQLENLAEDEEGSEEMMAKISKKYL